MSTPYEFESWNSDVELGNGREFEDSEAEWEAEFRRPAWRPRLVARPGIIRRRPRRPRPVARPGIIPRRPFRPLPFRGWRPTRWPRPPRPIYYPVILPQWGGWPPEGPPREPAAGPRGGGAPPAEPAFAEPPLAEPAFAEPPGAEPPLAEPPGAEPAAAATPDMEPPAAEPPVAQPPAGMPPAEPSGTSGALPSEEFYIEPEAFEYQSELGETFEGELSRMARPCGCPSCRRGELCPCKSQKEDLMTSMRDIQPEAFEFEPEFSFGKFDSRPAKRGVYETELELEDEYPEEPFPLPKWPPSRIFNPPPAQTIPAGPSKTFSPCQAIKDDFTKLTLAVDDLKNQLRQRPPSLARVSNRADVVTALSRQIVSRLKKLSYVQQGCTQQDMKLFASSVTVMRGGGDDPDTGSWPPASSSSVQGPRKQARESLRHLLHWIRRAERDFPRIQPEMSFGEFESDFEGEAPMSEFEWGAHEFEVAVPRTIHRLDCAAGCPGGLTEAQCAPLVSQAIIQAIKLANTAASKLEAPTKIEPGKRDNDAKETARLFRAFFGHDPSNPISYAGNEASGVSVAKRFRAVAKELGGERRMIFRCVPATCPAGADSNPGDAAHPACCRVGSRAFAVINRPELRSVVHLCPPFWNLPAASRGGTILHEMLHLLFATGPHGFLAHAGRRANAHCYKAFALRVGGYGRDLDATCACWGLPTNNECRRRIGLPPI